MKDRLLKALFVSITVALGITLVTIVQNEAVSFVKSGLYAIVAFCNYSVLHSYDSQTH